MNTEGHKAGTWQSSEANAIWLDMNFSTRSCAGTRSPHGNSFETSQQCGRCLPMSSSSFVAWLKYPLFWRQQAGFRRYSRWPSAQSDICLLFFSQNSLTACNQGLHSSCLLYCSSFFLSFTPSRIRPLILQGPILCHPEPYFPLLQSQTINSGHRVKISYIQGFPYLMSLVYKCGC